MHTKNMPNTPSPLRARILKELAKKVRMRARSINPRLATLNVGAG
jgi:hypothetical protein